MSKLSAHPPCQPPLPDTRGEGKRHHMHPKQQNQAKCHYPCWNPAKPLSSCPLGLAQQWRKAIPKGVLRAWAAPHGSPHSQQHQAPTLPPHLHLEALSPTAEKFPGIGAHRAPSTKCQELKSCQRQQLSCRRARAALGCLRTRTSAGSPRGPQYWSPSIQIHRHISLAWLLPRPVGTCLVSAG